MNPTRPILIADDEPLLTEILEFRLRAKGYETVIAHNGREALARFEELNPAAVVLDAMMPVHDGMEVLRRIRARETAGDVPVIILSARRNEEDIVRALEMGASDYMVKPFLPEELLVRLKRLLDARP
ncbi:response regulator transcription factor [Porphyrobacter sp. CACIAM 03H1]|uniref:response regulator transcription factor n=1 Tax=Porphyrobacter sp. CACIAM 03H1 TaxID=2003315 RepID=UPI000B5A7A0E|nr:response regulator [Porphyrobacter sp. CACIAM 03H1]ASJ90658.1 response regulator [Porphyrobacter sp. CACIAM 03H1]